MTLTETEVHKLLLLFHKHPEPLPVIQLEAVEKELLEMLDGSDTSMSAQLEESGFGSFGPM